MAKILLTGGAGYIGSHLSVLASEIGHETVIYDNFCNSDLAIIEKIEELTGQNLQVVEGDIRDKQLLSKTLIDMDDKTYNIVYNKLKDLGYININKDADFCISANNDWVNIHVYSCSDD